LILIPEDPQAICALLANLSSFAFDFIARQKVGGTHLTFGYLNQLPVFDPKHLRKLAPWSQNISISEWFSSRILKLLFTDQAMQPIANDLAYNKGYFKFDANTQFILRCEIDAAFFILYGLSIDDASYILDSFPIVRRHDENKYREYRTKNEILKIYDKLKDLSESKINRKE
jgi:hypothetical protein